jgi:hypothetical protein
MVACHAYGQQRPRTPADIKSITAAEADALTQELAQRGVRPLFLDGLTTLPADVAKIVVGFDGDLSLGGLSELTDEAAAELGRHKDNPLRLKGLTSLSAAAAIELARHENWLGLMGLTKISDEARPVGKSMGRDSVPVPKKLAGPGHQAFAACLPPEAPGTDSRAILAAARASPKVLLV